MDLHISLVGSRRLAADVYNQLKQAILDGRLTPGRSLPATRELAARLSVSRNTITGAYQRLISEGYVEGRVGAGTFVTTGSALPSRPRRAPSGAALRPRACWHELTSKAQPRPANAYDFQLGAPDPRRFPWDTWRSLVARQLRGRHRDGGYPPPEGDPRLRAAIARHVGIARSVEAGADDVLVTSGAQQAFDLIGRVLLEPGDCVAVEDPGYPPARQAWQALGARVVPVRVDAEGIDVSALPAAAKLVYVTPSHQFPLGTPMSLARRMALLAWADRHRAAIVEDDYDSEFRFDGRPLEPLQSIDRTGRVLYVGTFSKTLLPTLRLGFVIAPTSLMPSLHASKRLADSHGALDVQRALAELIDEGLFARHVRRLLRSYRARRDRLHAALARHLGEIVEVIPSSAGLHTSVYARGHIDTTALARGALAAGIYVEPLAGYYQRQPRSGLAFGYGMIGESKIDEGVRRLAEVFARAPTARDRVPASRRHRSPTSWSI